MSPSILLIIPYFGKFNNYFPFFLESCKNNPTINWLILTDDRNEYNFPSNVKVSYTTFKELKDRIQQLFQFQISLDRPLRVETSDTDRFMIIPNKIINPVAITTQSIRKLGREKIINYQYIRIKYANLKRRLKL